MSGDGYTCMSKNAARKEKKRQADTCASRQAGRPARKGKGKEKGTLPLQPELDLLTVMFLDGFP